MSLPERDLSAHLSFLIAFAVVLGLAESFLISSGKLGAAGAFHYAPTSLWYVVPLCWIALTGIIAIPSYALSRHGLVITTLLTSSIAVVPRIYAQSAPRLFVMGVAWLAAMILLWRAARSWRGISRKTSAALAGLALLSFLFVAITRPDATRPAIPRSASDDLPNILVAFIDTVPYDSIVSSGHSVDRNLPTLSALAADGIVFDRAYTTSPWTLPAHFSAVTGLPSHQLGLSFDDQRYSRSIPTLPQRLRRHGYRNAAVISNTFLHPGSGFERGFDSYEHASRALDVCRTAPGVILDRWWPWFAATVCNWTAGEVSDRAIAQLQRDERPVFLLLNYMDAHDPYYVERRCREDGDHRGAPLPRDVAPAAYRKRYYESHRRAIRCIDRQLGRVIEQLDAGGRRTIVAVLSDHGEQFGEHELVRHGNSLYDQLLHVPLIVKAPSFSPRHVTTPVSTEILAGLILSALANRPPDVTPRPVVSSLAWSAAHGGAREWSVIDGRWHLIVGRRDQELYDLELDPDEARNLISTDEGAPVKSTLLQRIGEARATQVNDQSAPFRSLGYIR